MQRYINPTIEILVFDEEEDILTLSVQATNSETQLNNYMFEEKSVESTTSIKLENIQLK